MNGFAAADSDPDGMIPMRVDGRTVMMNVEEWRAFTGNDL